MLPFIPLLRVAGKQNLLACSMCSSALISVPAAFSLAYHKIQRKQLVAWQPDSDNDSF